MKPENRFRFEVYLYIPGLDRTPLLDSFARPTDIPLVFQDWREHLKPEADEFLYIHDTLSGGYMRDGRLFWLLSFERMFDPTNGY